MPVATGLNAGGGIFYLFKLSGLALWRNLTLSCGGPHGCDGPKQLPKSARTLPSDMQTLPGSRPILRYVVYTDFEHRGSYNKPLCAVLVLWAATTEHRQ